MTHRRPEPVEPSEDRDGQRLRWALPPWITGGGRRRMLLITNVACLCVVSGGAAIAVLSSHGGSTAGQVAGASSSPVAASSGTAQPTAPVASSRVTSGPEASSGGGAGSAQRMPPRLKHRILGWQAGRGEVALAAVEKQMGTAMQAAGVQLYATMKLACVSLASDISTAQAAPPIPDGAKQRLYAEGLAGLSRAAADCRSAISVHSDGESVTTHVNEALLNRSRAEFAAMSKKLYQATSEILSVHR